MADALWRFGSGNGDSPPKLGTGGIPGTSNPRARFAGAAVDAGCDFDGSDIAAAESAWPEAAPRFEHAIMQGNVLQCSALLSLYALLSL